MENNMKILPYATWVVKEEEYKLKLDTAGIIKLEESFKSNLISVLDTASGIPPLAVMLKITHQAMLKYNHGIKLKEVYDLFDDYVDEGGSQTSFFTDTLMSIFQSGGFFSKNITEEMSGQLEKAKEMI